MKNSARRFASLSIATLQFATLAAALLFVLAVVMSPMAQAQTFTVLHSFTGGNDGSLPYGALAMEGSGTIFGTTSQGGGSGQNNGTVFKLTANGSSWTFSPIYEFTHGNDGAQPTGGITIGPGGVPYGTTTGGEGAGTNGTVFTLMPP